VALVAVMAGCDLNSRSGTGVPNETRVEDARLTREVPAALQDACEAAARRYAGAVYCPPLVPSGRPKVEQAGPLNRRGARASRSYLLDVLSASLEHDGARRRIGAGGGHWTVAGGTDPSLRALVRGGRTERSRVVLAGRRVMVHQMPSYDEQGGLYSDHVVVEWSRDGVRYQVSAHSRSNRGVALAIARELIALQRRCAAPVDPATCELVIADAQ
jgi:hypothetical protein